MNILRSFVLWLDVPVEGASQQKLGEYVDHLLAKRLKPKTINCHLNCIGGFYAYLRHEEGVGVANPVKAGLRLRVPKPLPLHLREEQVEQLFAVINKPRDRAMFRIMLRCGLRVDELAKLTLADLDLKRRKILVQCGKGGKGRVVYISDDALDALVGYLKTRPRSKAKRLFLVEKGPYYGRALSVRGIQKRMEYYAKMAGIDVSCHQLRHTMATQLLNADTQVETIQDLLGHNCITTTQRYCTVSNTKVMRDYFRAMEIIMHRTARAP